MITINLPYDYKQLNLPFKTEPLQPEVANDSSDTPPLQLTVKEIIEMYLSTLPLTEEYSYLDKFYRVLGCGTGVLGYHLSICDHCGSETYHPNLCNHSLCHVCQSIISRNWINNRISELLPVPYYQIVFGLTNKLNLFSLYNKKVVYDIFFECVEKAMNVGIEAKKIEIGYISILQPFSADMWHTPHIHLVIPGIGLVKGKIQEFPSKEYLPTSLEILKREFRDEFIKKLEELYLGKRKGKDPNAEPEKINWPNELKELANDSEKFEEWLEELKNEKWDVYIGEGTRVDSKELIYYVAQRLPISDEQIIGANLNKVVFHNTRNQRRELTLDEFVRRMSCLEMPSGYHRIRNYGFLGNSVKNQKLEEIREQLGLTATVEEEQEDPVKKCKICGQGKMRTVAFIFPGKVIKICDKNVEKIKVVPTWLDIISTLDPETTMDEIYDFLPDWLSELIQSVD
ncbi:MAG: transposase [Candidatus Magnetoglobus multicellularis str. Araruama]|uniref:Transposase n=1 Tax=Candidatus Magnetoglobus multicellularis str. Araruama TaxID=890399 RepID=A0A1V1NUX9_9BACT|nr:MAG: transposase [Candidatus Magnetoglobus multicellularis str. Araruama]